MMQEKKNGREDDRGKCSIFWELLVMGRFILQEYLMFSFAASFALETIGLALNALNIFLIFLYCRELREVQGKGWRMIMTVFPLVMLIVLFHTVGGLKISTKERIFLRW